MSFPDTALVAGLKIRKFQKPFTGTSDPIRVVKVYSSALVNPEGTNVMFLMLSTPVPVTVPPEAAQEGVFELDASILAKLKLMLRDEVIMTASLVLQTLMVALTPAWPLT